MRGAMQGDRSRPRRASRVVACVLAGIALCTVTAQAQDATWLDNPGSSDFDTPTNWTPATVPTGTAFFGTSTVTGLTFATSTTIGGWTFNAGASNYTFSSPNYPESLIFNGAGIVINGGSATITNNGVLEFLNASSAGSATIANTEDLEFLNSSSAGSATITNGGAIGTIFFFADNSTAGTATITNNGFLNFSGNSSAASAVITNTAPDGVLSFQDTTTAGNATIINNGSLEFLDSSTAGSANIVNSSTGFIDIESTAGSATITNNVGTVQFLLDGTAGSAAITNNGILNFDNNSTAGGAAITNSDFVFFNDNSSAGSASIGNGGSIMFGNSSTAGDASIVNQVGGFLLSFADTSSAGSATITTDAGSEVQFTDSATGGTARFITNAGGTFDMSGLTSGGMTAGSIEGAGTYDLGGNTLTVGGNNLSTTVNGTINDGGGFGGSGASLVKVGTGTLTLTGADTYTGATTIDGGTLAVDGSIADTSGVTVNAGGTLSGIGTVDPVATTTIMDNGTLAPGPPNGIGTLTIAGNLAFRSAALYLVTVSGANASSTDVGGAASLGGSVQVAFASLPTAKGYDILRATGGLGGTTFAGATAANFDPSLSYSASDVFLSLTAALGNTSGLNQNQQAAANAINGYLNNGGTLPTTFANLFNLTGAPLQNALTQLDGEDATGAETGAFDLMNEFLGLTLDPFVDGRGGSSTNNGALGFAPDQQASLPPDIALAYAGLLKAPPQQTFVQHWTTWAAGFGGSATSNGDPAIGSNNVSTSTYGYAAGLDYHYSPDTVLGFSLAGGGTNWDLAQGLGTGRSDALLAGVHGVTHAGPWYLGGARSPSPTTGSPPTALRLAMHSPQASKARAIRAGSKVAIGSLFPLIAMLLASRPTRRSRRRTSRRRPIERRT
jgi:autotransporter-associated beta strand protein